MQIPQFSGSNDRQNLMSMLSESNELNNKSPFETKVYQKNKYIYLSGDKSDSIYIIKNGRVKIGSQIDFEKKLIKGILPSGDFFREFSLLAYPINCTLPSQWKKLHYVSYLARD